MDNAATLDGRIRDKAKKELWSKVEAWKSFIYDGTIFGNQATSIEKNPGRGPEDRVQYYTISDLLDEVAKVKYKVSGEKVGQDAVDKFVSDFNELSNRVGDLEASTAQ